MMEAPFGNCYQEQSYSKQQLGWSLAWDHFQRVIANPCGSLTSRMFWNSCEILKTFMKHCKTLVKYYNTLIKHHRTLVKHSKTHMAIMTASSTRQSWHSILSFWWSSTSMIHALNSRVGKTEMCNRVTNLYDIPFGNCLLRTELLQSPFRMEFSIGSHLRRYCQPLRHYRQFLRRYCKSLQELAVARWLMLRLVVSNTAMPIFVQLTKQCKTLLNIAKHHETLVKHCQT